MHDSRSPPEPTLIPSRGFLTPPGGQLVQTLVGHSQSAVYGLAASSDGKYAVTGYADFFQYTLILRQALRYVQTDATLLANNSQHRWMLHVVSVCTPCRIFLRVVGTLLRKV